MQQMQMKKPGKKHLGSHVYNMYMLDIYNIILMLHMCQKIIPKLNLHNTCKGTTCPPTYQPGTEVGRHLLWRQDS